MYQIPQVFETFHFKPGKNYYAEFEMLFGRAFNGLQILHSMIYCRF